MAVTIVDVAREASVSIATVSRVINRPETVKDTTRQRVQDTIDRLGYRPNPWARTLPVGQPDPVIGLVIPEIHNPVFPELAEAVEREARHHGYQVILCHTDDQWAVELNYTRLLIDRKVTGIIFVSGSFSHINGITEGYHLVEQAGIPYVFVNARTDHASSVPIIASDEVLVGKLQAEYLLTRGHRRMAFLGGSHDYYVTRDRLSGITEAMRPFPESTLVEKLGMFTASHAARATLELFSEADPPTGIICASDLLALVVMREAYSAGFVVPRDFSIIGFDGIQMGRYAIPALTTVAQPLAQIGRRAVRSVLGKKMTGSKKLGLTVIEGESVRTLVSAPARQTEERSG